MWLSFTVGVLVLSIVTIGSFILLRGLRSRADLAFVMLAYGVAIWIALNFIGANFKSHEVALYATRLDFFTGCALAYLIWEFSASLLSQADSQKVRFWLYSASTRVGVFLLCMASALVTLLPNVVEVTKPDGQSLQVIYGDYYLLFALGLSVVLATVMMNFFLVLRMAVGRLRQQITLVLAALITSTVFIGFSNLMLPQLSESSVTNLVAGNLSYLGVAFFIFATFYAIVKHRLFDLRLVIARSVAYAAVIAILVGAYSFIAFFASATFVEDYDFSGSKMIAPAATIVLLAFSINPLLRFLGKGTNKLFYKDSYEPSQFLGNLNREIINNSDLGSLLEVSASIIERYIKSDFVIFEMKKVSPSRWVYPDGKTQKVDEAKFNEFVAGVIAQGDPVIVSDEFYGDQSSLKRYLEQLNVAVAIKLSTSSGEELGHIFLGHKKNGSPYNSKDLDVLSIAAGELVIAVQNALRFQEIENFNATLQEKIDEATRKLRRTNERLRILDQTKDDFISMASHQLRTPLTSVKGYVSMVLDGDGGKINDTQRKLLTQSFLSAQRMVYLISDLLNVSRLKTGKFTIEPAESKLNKVVEEELDQLTETVKSRGLTLKYHKPEHFPTLMIDETKLRQVIMNFVDNAIYYTPSGGHIDVYLEDKGESIEFRVVDDGIGVPKHEQHHLFTKFYRAKNAKRARPDGTGLGIFMAKKVIIAQGGAVIFSSKEGKGSTFGFTFPKVKLLPPPKPENKDKPAEKTGAAASKK